MFLIYGSAYGGSDPASHLVEFFPACMDPRLEYRVVNGGLYLQEVTRGDRRVLRPSEIYPTPSLDPEATVDLTMEWGATMRPRDAIRNSMLKQFSPGGSWDYNAVLWVARRLMTQPDGSILTFEQRLQRAAEACNPPPTSWDPEALIEGL